MLGNDLMTLYCAGEEDTPIGAMPGCYRLGWRHGLVEEVVLSGPFVVEKHPCILD